MKQLTIISHTEHYTNGYGELVGFGATVTEINELLDVFDSIVHVAVLYKSQAPDSALPYTSKAVTFVALPVVGGKGFGDKLNVILKALKILNIIHNALKGSTHFQFRAPTGMGVYVIPYLVFFSAKQGWFKYAGNWKQDHAPLAYRFQRWLLINQKRKVTINGHWDNQPKHCLSFENPCLTEEELRDGEKARGEKLFNKHRKTLCFVGRLDASKGFDLFVESLNELNSDFKNRIETVHIVGEMKEQLFEGFLEVSGLAIKYHDTLARADLHEIYKQSHFIILPSKSEGFPKVISEALNYGCIPVVSSVSSIGQYIKEGENGILINELSLNCLLEKLQQCLILDENSFKQMMNQHKEFYNQFSYKHYNQRILKELF